MKPAPRSSSPRRWPLWLVSGGLCLLVLAASAVSLWLPRFLPRTEVEVSRGPEFEGGLTEVELDGSVCTIEEIDSEIPEIAPAPERTDWQIASERATTIELPMEKMCDLFAEPPPRIYRPELDPKFWKLPGREHPSRGALIRSTGTNEEKENAVASALQWLAAHQLPDGGWSFAHRSVGLSPCPADCQHEGTYRDARPAATALVLLPFLGAGQTHKQGKYKKNVEAALYFLCQQMKVMKVHDVQCGIFATDTNIPAQSLCTLALCEAYALTHDKGLKDPAQYALNQLLREPAVLDDGFRWMAIRSGESAYLDVKATEQHRAELLAATVNDRSQHKFAVPGRKQALVAVGLLDRIFEMKAPVDVFLLPEKTIATPKAEPNLQPSLNLLGEWGPGTGDLDYVYFATQALRHRGGDPWDDWHKKMVKHLINSQEKSEHQKGSWHFADDDGAKGGGRLYCTAMATMILEVYYRHLPVYGK